MRGHLSLAWSRPRLWVSAQGSNKAWILSSRLYEHCPKFSSTVHPKLHKCARFLPLLWHRHRAMNIARFLPLLWHKHRTMNIARFLPLLWHKHRAVNIARFLPLLWHKHSCEYSQISTPSLAQHRTVNIARFLPLLWHKHRAVNIAPFSGTHCKKYLVKITASAGYCSFRVHWTGG